MHRLGEGYRRAFPNHKEHVVHILLLPDQPPPNRPTGKHHSLQSSFTPQEGDLAVLQGMPCPHVKLWPREGEICTPEREFP